MISLRSFAALRKCTPSSRALLNPSRIEVSLMITNLTRIVDAVTW
jgi:dynein heavy chain, axonemal